MNTHNQSRFKIYYIVPIIAVLGMLGAIYYKLPNESVYKAENPTPPLVIIKEDPASMKPLTLFAVGDIMLGRHVENLMNKWGDDYPFLKADSILKDADIVLANLEGPIVSKHVQTPSQSTHFDFAPKTAQMLAQHGIDIVSLANNHTYDLGTAGYNETVNFLDNAQVKHVGNPFSVSDKYVLRTEVKSQKLIFVAFNITNPNFNFATATDMVAHISRDPGDFMIAVIHGGEEYALTSNSVQKNFYRKLIDSGVNVVIAHHPHVVQEIEVYKKRPIFYSLGNFIFDQYFSKDVQEELGVHMTFGTSTIQYDLIPFKSVTSQPRLMTDEEKSVFLYKLAQKSSTSYWTAIKNGKIILTK